MIIIIFYLLFICIILILLTSYFIKNYYYYDTHFFNIVNAQLSTAISWVVFNTLMTNNKHTTILRFGFPDSGNHSSVLLAKHSNNTPVPCWSLLLIQSNEIKMDRYKVITKYIDSNIICTTEQISYTRLSILYKP